MPDLIREEVKREPRKEPFRLSASAIKLYKECPRKYAFRYLSGLPKPEQSEPQRFGTECHKVAENWLRDGITPDSTTYAGRLFLAGVRLLPPVGSCDVEREFKWTIGGVDWIAYVDFLHGSTIGDHKFQVKPRVYGLNEESLPSDFAAILYALAVADAGISDSGKYSWIYYDKSSKSRPDAYAVEAPWRKETALAKYEEQIVPLVRRVKDLRVQLAGVSENLLDTINEVENDPQACEGCGRFCDYVKHCNIWNIKKGPAKMGRLDELNKQAPKVQEPAKAPETAVATELGSLSSRLAALTQATTAGVNPPEAAKALEETKREIAGEPEPEAPAVKRGRKKAEPKPAEESDTIPAPENLEMKYPRANGASFEFKVHGVDPDVAANFINALTSLVRRVESEFDKA